MPPRWLSALIVIVWVGTTGWLLYQNVWPLLTPDEAPPYTIDLEDEVQTQQIHIRWIVSYNDRPCLHAETWVEPNPADDAFALQSELRPILSAPGAVPGPSPFGGLVEIRHAASTYRVSRQGDLRAVSIEVSASIGGAPGEGSLTGEVRDGRFRPHVRASCPALPKLGVDADLDPVAVSGHGSILSPMHPLNRIAGLRPGQTWRLPLVDPLRTVVSALAGKYLGELAPDADQEMFVAAHVLPQKQALVWNNNAVPCFVIEYQGADVSAKTWVQADTGLVLRQEAERGGESWALQRE